MNNLDRERLDNVEGKVVGLKDDINDLYGCYNDVSESLDEIKNNHLVHLEAKCKLVNLKANVTIAGLAFIAIMIAILGCMIAF